MPTKTNKRRTALKTRTRPSGRAAKRTRAPRSGPQQPRPAAVIAPSIHRLKLKEKKGVEVFQALGVNDRLDVDIEKLYNDVFACYSRMRELLLGEPSFDVYNNTNLEFKVSLYHYLTEIQKLCPQGWESNIDRDDNTGDYFITLFHSCRLDPMWNCIEVKHALLKLAKENRALHDLFVSFLRSFSSGRKSDGVAVDMWHEGMMGDMRWYMEESLEQMKIERDLDDPDDVAFLLDYEADMDNYSKGEAYKYSKRISKAKVLKADELIKRAKRFKAGNPIANMIYQGAHLMGKYTIRDFQYYPYGDISDSTFLPLDDQFTIIWDANDNATKEFEEHLDAMGQEGVQEPYASIAITPKIKEINFYELNKAVNWPLELQQYFSRANKLIKDYLHK